MTARDFAKSRMRQRIARKGSEAITGGRVGMGPPAPRQSKAKLRDEAAALMSPSTMITKTLTCSCGHVGKVRVALARVDGPFRCVKCHKRMP